MLNFLTHLYISVLKKKRRWEETGKFVISPFTNNFLTRWKFINNYAGSTFLYFFMFIAIFHFHERVKLSYTDNRLSIFEYFKKLLNASNWLEARLHTCRSLSWDLKFRAKVTTMSWQEWLPYDVFLGQKNYINCTPRVIYTTDTWLCIVTVCISIFNQNPTRILHWHQVIKPYHAAVSHTPQQQCCRDACQMSEQLDTSRGF